jgi:hypothetical protein
MVVHMGGSKYNQQQYKLHDLHYKTSLFLPLPMLCSSSIKNVTIPKSNSSFSTDPVSPKISCIGQVKKHNNPASSHRQLTITATNRGGRSNQIKYSKLKGIFSTKSLPVRSREDNNTRSGSVKKDNKIVNVVDLDPPLPVIKKVFMSRASDDRDDGEDRNINNLYKRRSGGVVLKNLQLKQIHHQVNNCRLEANTV